MSVGGVSFHGVSVQGFSVWGSLSRGLCPGVSIQGVSVQSGDPPVDRLTHTSENITFPQLPRQLVTSVLFPTDIFY